MGNRRQTREMTMQTTSRIHETGSAAQLQEFDSAPTVRKRRLMKIMQTLESRLVHTVRELAQEVHLSPAHLQRLFKQETGVDISDFLREQRLTRAADLLTTTNMGMKEVAHRAGYGHHSSFVRAFGRRFGQAPSRYRLKRASSPGAA